MAGDYRRGDDRGRDDYDVRRDEFKGGGFKQSTDDGGGGGGGDDDCSSQIIGWVIFILIFGVGNAILYSTTGILFIPIPRR